MHFWTSVGRFSYFIYLSPRFIESKQLINSSPPHWVVITKIIEGELFLQSFIFNQGLGNDASVVAIILHLWMLLTGLKPVMETFMWGPSDLTCWWDSFTQLLGTYTDSPWLGWLTHFVCVWEESWNNNLSGLIVYLNWRALALLTVTWREQMRNCLQLHKNVYCILFNMK